MVDVKHHVICPDVHDGECNILCTNADHVMI